MRKSHKFLIPWVSNFLVKALSVEVEHTRVGRIEFLVHNCSNLSTLFAFITKRANSNNLIILILSIVSMHIQILILVDAKCKIIPWFPTLARISAGISDHDSFEINFDLCIW